MRRVQMTLDGHGFESKEQDRILGTFDRLVKIFEEDHGVSFNLSIISFSNEREPTLDEALLKAGVNPEIIE